MISAYLANVRATRIKVKIDLSFTLHVRAMLAYPKMSNDDQISCDLKALRQFCWRGIMAEWLEC